MQRYRLRFSKRDRLRFISHRDLVQVFERALRRAKFDVAHTQGFNPRPKIVFAIALPLGVESLDEVVDVELMKALEPDDLLARLGPEFPPGLDLKSCIVVGPKEGLQVCAATYRVDLPPEWAESIKASLDRFEASSDASVVRERKGRTRKIDLKPFVLNISYDAPTLHCELQSSNEGGIKAAELLEWLGFDPLELKIVKTQTQLA